MNHPFTRIAAVLVLASGLLARGNTLYVDLNSANPTVPYSDWSTAATNIQDAIEASSDGDQIWVTNGVYQTGGKVMLGDLTNRVALDKAVTVQSVNGPFVTTIAGIGATNGTSAVRCAWLTNNAALVGFTLTKGATRTSGISLAVVTGGGVWCASSNAAVMDCVIVSNTAYDSGGAGYQGTFDNCYISGNSVSTSLVNGAIRFAILNNSTAVSNNAVGLYVCQATNSIIYYNRGVNNYSGGSFSYCCVTPAAGGTGNFTNAPVFFPDNIHLALGSPGVGAGTTPVTSADMFGRAWGAPPTVGCAETLGSAYVSQPQMQLTSSPIGFTIMAAAIGDQPLSYAWLKNGILLQDDGHFSGTQSTKLIASGIHFTDGMDYQFVASNSSGAVTSSVVHLTVHCVDAAGSNPLPPYTSWETAATNIQDAIDAATAGEVVLVTNGVYSTGGKVISGDLTNRVALDKALTVTSVNGYNSTVIEGQWDIVTTNGPGAVRCAWLTNGAVLSGFSLRNGATRGSASTLELEDGGGAWLSTNAIVSNCVLTNNSAYAGGGMAFGIANSCYFTYNIALNGGGAYQASLNNCTLRSNRCYSVFSGGVDTCTSRNCIIMYNYRADSGAPELSTLNYPSSSQDKFTNCCTSPLPSRGASNITSEPQFLNFSGGFALSPTSPCLGAGNSLFATGLDLDGEPFLNPPAIGCDEINAATTTGPLAITFLHVATNTLVYHRFFFAPQFDGRASELDWSFGDGPTVTNQGGYTSHTWTNAGTYTVTLTAYNADHPTGVSSNRVVRVDPFLSPSIQGAGVVSNAFQFNFLAQGQGLYNVQYATNLTPPVAWQNLQSFLFSASNMVMTIRDPAVTNGQRFYRIFGQ